MPPDIIINPSEGESFKPKTVHISNEAARAAGVSVILSDISLDTSSLKVSPESSNQITKLAQALVDSSFNR